MKRISVLLITCAFVLGAVTSGWAVLGPGTSVEGTVKAISAHMLTITSQQADGMGIQELNIAVNDQTKLRDISSLSDLKQGDRVKVNYTEENNQKVALEVTKETEAAMPSGSAPAKAGTGTQQGS